MDENREKARAFIKDLHATMEQTGTRGLNAPPLPEGVTRELFEEVRAEMRTLGEIGEAPKSECNLFVRAAVAPLVVTPADEEPTRRILDLAAMLRQAARDGASTADTQARVIAEGYSGGEVQAAAKILADDAKRILRRVHDDDED